MNFLISYLISFILTFIIIFILIIISKNKAKLRESNNLFLIIFRNIFNFRNLVVFCISFVILFIMLFFLSYYNHKVRIMNSESYIFAKEYIKNDNQIKEKYGEINNIDYLDYTYFSDESYGYVDIALKIIGSKCSGKVSIRIRQKLTPYEVFEIRHLDDIK